VAGTDIGAREEMRLSQFYTPSLTHSSLLQTLFFLFGLPHWFTTLVYHIGLPHWFTVLLEGWLTKRIAIDRTKVCVSSSPHPSSRLNASHHRPRQGEGTRFRSA
jgi:hypothetical protein